MFWKRNKKPKTQALELTDQNFNDHIPNNDMPVLIDFWAPWCGPCRIVGPIIDELADEFDGRAIVAKINVDQNPNLSNHFKVKSIPTLVMFEKDQMVERWSGLVPKPNLEEILNAYIEDWKKDKEA